MPIEILAKRFYEYSQHIKGYSLHTIRRYRYVLNSFQNITGITDLSAVSQQSVLQVLFHGRTQKQWSSNTIVVFYKSLKVFFEWCKKNGLLETNPVDGIEKTKIEQKLPQKLSKQDALRLLEVVYNYPYSHTFLRHRNHAIFATFVFAGLRKSELLHLHYTDVDLETMILFVRQGKGGKDRIVPISQKLGLILHRYIEERRKRVKTCPEFFVSLQYNRAFTDDGLDHLVSLMKKVSGLTFSVHKLRHSFATLMIEGGCDIYSLAKMMGHSDIKTTTIYLSASAEHLRSQIVKHPLN